MQHSLVDEIPAMPYLVQAAVFVHLDYPTACTLQAAADPVFRALATLRVWLTVVVQASHTTMDCHQLSTVQLWLMVRQRIAPPAPIRRMCLRLDRLEIEPIFALPWSQYLRQHVTSLAVSYSFMSHGGDAIGTFLSQLQPAPPLVALSLQDRTETLASMMDSIVLWMPHTVREFTVPDALVEEVRARVRPSVAVHAHTTPVCTPPEPVLTIAKPLLEFVPRWVPLRTRELVLELSEQQRSPGFLAAAMAPLFRVTVPAPVPVVLRHLTHLTSLEVSCNGFHLARLQLPSSLSRLVVRGELDSLDGVCFPLRLELLGLSQCHVRSPWQHLPPHLRTLDLSCNEELEPPPAGFAHASLKLLKLQSCRITRLSQWQFPDTLAALDLSFNPLTEPPPSSYTFPAHLRDLEVWSCGSCEWVFRHLPPHLATLRLSVLVAQVPRDAVLAPRCRYLFLGRNYEKEPLAVDRFVRTHPEAAVWYAHPWTLY